MYTLRPNEETLSKHGRHNIGLDLQNLLSIEVFKNLKRLYVVSMDKKTGDTCSLNSENVCFEAFLSEPYMGNPNIHTCVQRNQKQL